MPKIVENAKRFCLCVSQMGVTGGEAHNFHTNLHKRISCRS